MNRLFVNQGHLKLVLFDGRDDSQPCGQLMELHVADAACVWCVAAAASAATLTPFRHFGVMSLRHLHALARLLLAVWRDKDDLVNTALRVLCEPDANVAIGKQELGL